MKKLITGVSAAALFAVIAVQSGLSPIGAANAAGLKASPAGTTYDSGTTITVTSWGGAYTKSQVEAMHKPFSATTGVKINSEDYNGGLAEVRAQVESGNVVWDVLDVERSDAVRGCDDGLFETIDTSTLPKGLDGTPASADFIDGALGDCYVANIYWSTVYAYDKSVFTGAQPKTMADFFDTKKFPGKRGMQKNPKPNLEFALIADGVATKDVYKLLETKAGVDRAFAKLDSIKDDVVWWESGAQPPQLLADGEVVMTTAYNGRLFNAIYQEGKPFEIVWDGQILDTDLWVIPKGSKNKQVAMDFIAFTTGTKPLADQSLWISYGPARKSSSSLVKADILPHLPTSPQNFKNPLQNDFEFWADNADSLNERFNAWLAQ